MRITVMALLLLAAAPLAMAADDFKVIKLEQDVRNLEQQVRELSRQVAQLQRGSSVTEQLFAPAERAAPGATGSTAWLDAGSWGRIRDGMSELEVINLLGPPTSMRTDAGSRTLFYAMQIGSSGFFGGHVRFADRKVIEVQKPELK